MTPATTVPAPGTWVAHLAEGGTTRWREWDGPVGEYRSGAHLEVLRRLNELGRGHELADLVLGADVVGRGMVDVPVPRAGRADRLPSGTPAVEPDELPTGELLRVCAAAIARRAAASEPTPHDHEAHRELGGRRLLRHTPWVVGGTSAAADALRHELRASGTPEGRRKSIAFVIGGPLDELMAGHWHRRTLAGSSVRWRRLWEVACGGSRLPAAIDPLAQAREWTQKVGHQRVHVVLDEDPAPVVADILGVEVTVRPDHSPTASELMRRINQVLAGLVDEEAHLARVPDLISSIPRSPETPLGVPLDHHRWAAERAEEIAAGLEAGPWQVHGPTRRITPDERPRRRTVDPEDTLDLALLTLLSVDTGEDARRRHHHG